MKNEPKVLTQLIKIVSDELTKYIVESQEGKGKVLLQQRPEVIAAEIGMEGLIKYGSINAENIADLLRSYLKNTQHLHHPGYIGHQVAVPNFGAAIADMVHGFVNNPMAVYEMGPAAATMEKVVINWMLDKIGWFKGDSWHESIDEKIVGGGVLTHGGSLANMTAMLAARAKIAPDTWTEGIQEELYILAPEMTHYSIARAVSIMGIGSKNIVPIKVDKNEVVIPDQLYNKLHVLRKEGKKVMAVVANACATSTGLYDPLDEVGSICNELDLWFHIDGAHGAGALLDEQTKHLMKGANKADSMIWDAHKMLRTSALSAAVLFKDYKNLDQTFRQKGSYLIFDKEKIGFDFLHNTVECTKGGLGPKLFWALAEDGERGIANYITESYSNTRKFYDIIQAEGDFECPYVPQSNILCFKYTGARDSDEFQLKIRNEVVREGNFYITSTTIKEKRYLRLTLMNPDTGEEHIRSLLEAIRNIAGKIA